MEERLCRPEAETKKEGYDTNDGEASGGFVPKRNTATMKGAFCVSRKTDGFTCLGFLCRQKKSRILEQDPDFKKHIWIFLEIEV